MANKIKNKHMKRQIKIYKNKEEIEQYYKELYERMALQEILQNLSTWQQRELRFNNPTKNKKGIFQNNTFSAS